MRGSDAVYDQDTEVDQTEEEHHTRPDPSRYLHVATEACIHAGIVRCYIRALT